MTVLGASSFELHTEWSRDETDGQAKPLGVNLKLLSIHLWRCPVNTPGPLDSMSRALIMQRSLHRRVEKIRPEWFRYYSIHIVKRLQNIIATDGESVGSIESGPGLANHFHNRAGQPRAPATVEPPKVSLWLHLPSTSHTQQNLRPIYDDFYPFSLFCLL